MRNFALALEMSVLACGLLLVLLPCIGGAPQSFRPQGDVGKCVGEPVTFTCTVVDDDVSTGVESTVWRASGGIDCLGNIAHVLGLSDPCSDGDPNTDDPFSIDGIVQNTNCVVFELSAAMATVNMDNTLIECYNSTAADPSSLVGSSRLFVEGNMPSAPADVMVTFNNSDFIIQWSSSTVGSFADISGYSIDISGPDDGCGGRSAPLLVSAAQGPPYQYTCPMPSVGGTYTITVSAECGTLEGTAVEVTLTPRVPGTPQLKVAPVYDQSTGDLLRIESQFRKLPPVTLAITTTGFILDEEPSRYLFTYSGGTTPLTQIVENNACTGGECMDVFTVPSVGVPSEYEVAVAAENRIGMGQLSPSRSSSTVNNLLAVEVVNIETVVCRFLGGFTGTAECQIEYSTQEDLSGSVVDTGNSTSGDSVTVTITTTLQKNATYYYIVTSTADDLSLRVQGLFQTTCLLTDLVQGMDSQFTIEGCDSPRFEGGLMTFVDIGRVYYNGTSIGATALYSCSCPEYRLEGVSTRVCQSDGTWTGTVPECLRKSLSLVAIIGITIALTFLVAFAAGLFVAFALVYCYIWRQKAQYSLSDSQQPTTIQDSTQGDINVELKENISYGPVPSQPPVTQPHQQPMYDEVVHIEVKAQYSPSDPQQPTTIQTSTQEDIELKENISYGPVPSQLPAPQRRRPRYEGVVQTGNMEVKAQYSPSDSQQPTTVQTSTQEDIELKENISYGPVPSQLPAPQRRRPRYEGVVQTGNIEVKANVAYGPISH